MFLDFPSLDLSHAPTHYQIDSLWHNVVKNLVEGMRSACLVLLWGCVTRYLREPNIVDLLRGEVFFGIS